MVWPILGSRTAKEQNRYHVEDIPFLRRLFLAIVCKLDVIHITECTEHIATSQEKFRSTVICNTYNKKFSSRRGTARCVVSVEILPIATQQYSTTSPEEIEVMKLEG